MIDLLIGFGGGFCINVWAIDLLLELSICVKFKLIVQLASLLKLCVFMVKFVFFDIYIYIYIWFLYHFEYC